MANIDMHIHSAYSADGEFSVSELLTMCKQAQITYMAITDHNTVKAVPKALLLGQQMGIQVISGVELDCVFMGRNFHLLGYNFDYTNPTFLAIEQNILEQERSTARQRIELFQKETGIPICVDEVLAAAPNGVVTGELIAEILLKKENAGDYEVLKPYLPGGTLSNNPLVNFYWDYFAQGKPAYVPIEYMSLEEAVALLHATGGIAVLAHPGQNLKGDFDLLKQIMDAGIDGIEAYSSYHGRVAAASFEIAARQNKLLVTCGSDFHGKAKPSIPLCGHKAEENMSDIIAALSNAGILNSCNL